MTQKSKSIVGWREWVTLPAFGNTRVKAKIDTGARTSSLHAYDLEIVQNDGQRIVRFTLHPLQRDTTVSIPCQTPLIEHRWVRSSSGHRTLRPVVSTIIELMGTSWEIDLTLTNRDEMGFRMLLGREAIRRRFLVDSGRSYLAGRPQRDEATTASRIERIRQRKRRAARRDT